MKQKVKLTYPNAECIWRDGAILSYEIWAGNKRLSPEFCLSAKKAWKNAFVTHIQKSVTEIGLN